MKYKLVIYDLDGTLLDSRSDLANAINAMRGFMGLAALPDEAVYAFVGQGARALVQKSMPEATREDALDRALQFFRNYYFEHSLGQSALYPGVRDFLLARQHEGVRQAVCTNKPHKPTVHILQGLGVHDLFDLIVGSENGFQNKPHPASTQFILNTCGMQADQTLFVGDSDIDLQTARASQLDCVLLRCGFTPSQVLDQLRYEKLLICNDFIELSALPVFSAGHLPEAQQGLS